jgi:ATP-dependent RNA helicase DDX51/DBP6
VAAPPEVGEIGPATNRTKTKKKQDREPLDLRTGDDTQDTAQVVNGDGGQYGNAQPRPKKRRHKLEAVLQDEHQQEEAPNNDQEHLKKHSGILKKFQQSAQIAQNATNQEASLETEQEDTIQPTILDLAPLPQPAKVPTPEFIPDPASALPSWVANPTIVSNEDKSSFVDLNLDPKTATHLSKLRFTQAMPVQKALIPILLPPGTPGANYLPGTEPVLPDMAVSAPTGSGKTIAYLVPIIESLKKVAGIGRLKALVVVPTRELVTQVAAIAVSLAKGTSIEVGMLTGPGAFKAEQARIIKRGRRYDPKSYNELLTRAHRRNYPPTEDSEEFDDFLKEIEREDVKEEQRIRDTVKTLVGHVPTYDSAFEILVATPGRLLEHLSSTLGFSLAHLEWLVLDEADKLLDLQYDGFLETVNNELSRPRREDEQDGREQYLRASKSWDEQRERRVRKVVLSATMTRDISKLVELKLRWPRMLVVRGGEQLEAITDSAGVSAANGGVKELDGGFELPFTLNEFCVPVGDGSEKPLYLVELLRTKILGGMADAGNHEHSNAASDNELEADDSEDSASSDSSSESDLRSTSSTSSSSDEAESGDQAAGSPKSTPVTTAPDHIEPEEPTIHPSRAALLSRLSSHHPTVPTILIFTSSNEATTRLAHLLQNLVPEWATYIGTMTRADSKAKSLPHTDKDKPLITVSTDRAARGLDALGSRAITHVVQYDVPRSVTGYVHRVGRTARAGGRGEAWTLFEGREGRWFTMEVVKGKGIRRVGGVEKTKIGTGDEEMKERLREVVEGMRREVVMGRKGK